MSRVNLSIIGYLIWMLLMFYFCTDIDHPARVIICIAVTIGWSGVTMGLVFNPEFRSEMERNLGGD